MKLKSLNSSFLSESDIIKLNLANIQTTEQLVTYADLEALSRLTSIPLKNLKLIKKYIIGQYSPFPEQGNAILDKYIKRLFIVETGCKNIDEIISNGFYSGEISEITGATSTGKSQLCFQLIVNMLSTHQDFSCVYIDSSKNLCTKRINDLLNYKMSSSDSTNLLKSIKLLECSNIFHLLDLLFKITKTGSNQETNNQDSFTLSPNLLIIDNLTTLFNQFKPNSYLEINYYLNYMGNYLKYLANSMKMLIIVVTNRSSYETNANNYNLTNNPLWLNTPNLIVCLKNVNENETNVKKFEILKRNRPFFNESSKSFCYFSVNQNGIF